MKKILAALALLVAIAFPAAAQNVFNTAQSGKTVIGTVAMCLNGSGIAVPTDQNGACPGGSTGGSVTVYGPTIVGTPAAHPPILVGGTTDGTATGNVEMLKVSGGLAFINCANCSGSGASAADAATYVPSSSIFAPSGGMFQTIPTNNPLTNLQQGLVQMTAQRAFFVNPRNSSGTEIGTASNPFRVDPTGSTTQPVSGTVSVTGSSVSVSNFPATQPISGSVSLTGTLPAYAATPTFNLGTLNGAATAANQSTMITSLSSIDGKTPALGQALAAASVPVVLTASQLSTLTPPSTVAVTQSTSPWVVSLVSTTITGTVAVTQSGAWNLTNISGTISLPTGAATAANQTSVIGSLGGGTAATSSIAVGGQYNSTPITLTNTQQSGLQLDANGFLKVNIASGGGSGGTSSTFGAAFPGTGTAVGMSQGGNMVAMTGTAGNLNVQCANCSGSGASAVDEVAFTAGSSVLAPGGGFFQTTATNNALTTGQQGMVQMTAQRAFFVNLRNASGTEIGTSGNPVRTDPTGTTTQPVSLTSTTITGTVAVTQSGSWSLAANQSVNVAQINGVTPLMGNGVTGTGSQRVTIASDNTPFTVNAAQSGTWNVNVASAVGLAQGSTTSGQTGSLVMGAVTTGAPTYTTAQTNPLSLTTAGALRVDGSGVTQPVSLTSTTITGSVTVAQSTSSNLKAQVDPLTAASWGLGATAAAVPANAAYVAMNQGGSLVGLTGTSGNLNVQCSNCSGSGVSTADGATFTAGASLFAGGGGFFQTTATSNALTNGQQGMFQVTANRALFTNLRNASGTEVGVAATPLQVSLANTGANGTAIAVNATLQATATTAIGKVDPNTVASWGLMSGTVPGTAPTNTMVIGAIYNSAAPAPTTGQTLPLQTDSSGNLKVVGTGIAIGSTTSGQTGSLVMGATTTAAPTYTTAQSNPLSLTTAGDLRTVFSNTSIAATQSGTWTVQPGNTANTTAWLVTGTGGTFPVTQATASNLNAQVVGTVASGASDSGNPIKIGGVFNTTQPTVTTGQRVDSQMTARGAQIVSTGVDTFNVTVNAALPAGTNLMGKVGIDQTTPGTTNGTQDASTGATAAAPPSKAAYIGANASGATGGNLKGMIQCDSTATYDASTTGSTQLVALAASQTIYVCGYAITVGGTATNVKLVYGTGTNCATGATNMTPAYQIAANGGIVDKSPFFSGLKTASANALCVNASAANAVQVIVYYAQF